MFISFAIYNLLKIKLNLNVIDVFLLSYVCKFNLNLIHTVKVYLMTKA